MQRVNLQSQIERPLGCSDRTAPEKWIRDGTPIRNRKVQEFTTREATNARLPEL